MYHVPLTIFSKTHVACHQAPKPHVAVSILGVWSSLHVHACQWSQDHSWKGFSFSILLLEISRARAVNVWNSCIC